MKEAEISMNPVDYPRRNSLNNNSEDFGLAFDTLMSSDYWDNTKRAIFADMKDFVGWYNWINDEPFDFRRCSRRDIIDYKAWLIHEEKSTSTINRRLSHLKLFFKTGLELWFISKLPTQGVKQLPRPSAMPKALSQSELRKFLKEVDIRGNIRDRLIVELMAFAGLRVSEVVAIKAGHVQISERRGEVFIPHSKWNKTRKVPICRTLRETFGEFYKKHPAEEPDAFLFQWQRWTLTERGINRLIDVYWWLSGVFTHPHAFRHTFATNFLKQNPGELVVLSQILGHTNINTTAIYTQQSFQSLQDKVEDINI